MKKKSGVKPAGRGRSENAAVLLLEAGVVFALMYFTAVKDLRFHEYIRFAILLPMYQAGAWFGLTGGAMMGAFCSLMFMVIVPYDRLVMEEQYGIASMVVMLIFIIGFGLFVGLMVGRSRAVRRRAESVARITMKIAGSSDEREVMRHTAAEAADGVRMKFGAALLEEEGSPAPVRLFISSGTDSAEAPADMLKPDNPLVRSMRTDQNFDSRGFLTDPRFSSSGGEGIGAVAVFPVTHDGTTYGSVMKACAMSVDDDVNELRFLVRTAGAAIRNIRQERATQIEILRERNMKDIFSRFVSANVAEHLLRDGEAASGIMREITVLVSDIRDFTRISESLTPQQIVAQLNDYFSVVVDVVLEHGGAVDKYIGDCIIAYWGAPEPDELHAQHAADAALRMAGALAELNSNWGSRGMPRFEAGIGLHTGEMLLCNIGNEHKMNFTLVGEEIRSATNVESLTKEFGEKIVVTGATAAWIGASFSLEKLRPAQDGGEYFALRGPSAAKGGAHA